MGPAHPSQPGGPGRRRRPHRVLGVLQVDLVDPWLDQTGPSRRCGDAPRLGHGHRAVSPGAPWRQLADPRPCWSGVLDHAGGDRRFPRRRASRFWDRGLVRPLPSRRACLHAIRGGQPDGPDPCHRPDGRGLRVEHRCPRLDLGGEHRRLSHLLPGGDQHAPRIALARSEQSRVDAVVRRRATGRALEAAGARRSALHLHRVEGHRDRQHRGGAHRRAARRVPDRAGTGPAHVLLTVRCSVEEALRHCDRLRRHRCASSSWLVSGSRRSSCPSGRWKGRHFDRSRGRRRSRGQGLRKGRGSGRGAVRHHPPDPTTRVHIADRPVRLREEHPARLIGDLDCTDRR